MQSVMGRKVFSKQSQEFLADVSIDMLAKRWVKPRDVSFPLFLFLGAKDNCILQFISVPALMHTLHVLRDCFGEFLAVARELREASSKPLWQLLLDSWRMVRQRLVVGVYKEVSRWACGRASTSLTSSQK